MMKTTPLFAAALALALGGTSFGQTDPAPGPETKTGPAVPEGTATTEPMAPDNGVSDPDYANMMAISDSYEIKAGNLAKEKSKNADVKNLAQMIVDDHTASNAELQEIVGGMNASIKDSLDDKHQAMLDALAAAADADFDKTYLDQQVAAHTEGLKLNQGFAAGDGNNDLKRLANKVIPKMQMHLDMAVKLGGTPPPMSP